MLNHLRSIIWRYQQDGLFTVFLLVMKRLKFIPMCVLFFILDYFATYERNEISIVIRGGSPESDTFALLNQIEHIEKIDSLCIVTETGRSWNQYDLLRDQIDNTKISVTTKNSMSFIRHLLNSRIVFIKNRGQIRWYRLISSSHREYIRLYHGPITKGEGRTRAKSSVPPNLPISFSLVFDNQPNKISVGSDTERYFRSAAENLHPGRFKKYGYPRFERIRDIKSNNVDPIIPEKSKNLLENDTEKTDILYAPTHKDRQYDTTFFPFEEFELKSLQEHLLSNNIRIFIRPHPSEKADYNHLIDNETIYKADQSFCNSTTEMLPYFDALITDYSSVYMEFLLLDKPILFVKDNHSKFQEIRGLAFDYETFFPGKKIDTFNEFIDEIQIVSDTGKDGFASDRALVRRTFLKPKEQTFLRRCLSSLEDNT